MKKLLQQPMLLLLVTFLISLIVLALGGYGFRSSLEGLLHIQIHPARLINDYIQIVGPGGALLNAALVGLVGLILIKTTGISLSGPTFAAVLTMTGFGLFGKTPLNILPIILGVWISAKIVKKGLRDYLIIALFGTALGPLVSALVWELGLPVPWAILTAIVGGGITGFFLPAVAVAMLHLHQGYNLYNMGLSCGFFGLFAAALLKGFGVPLQGDLQWYQGHSWGLILMIPILSIFLILFGWIRRGGKAWKEFREIQKLPGRLPSDFVDMSSLSGAMINSGLVGLIAWIYVYFIGADFNGPVLGGILTIMGFGAFGTHLMNSWPVVTGVLAATVATGKELNSPGPILAAIFCTTLGPLAGEFGILAGIGAGFIHLLMVSQSGAWHGGMNLYNNGFAGGLTAALFVAVIQWYRNNRTQF